MVLATDIFFVSTYFTLTEPSYQVLGTALVFCIPPIAAAAAFREMGQKASLITAKNAGKVNEIMNSTNSPSGDNSGIAGTDLPEKTTRISWGGRHQPNHSRHDPLNLENHGILVTVGTVSPSEEVDETWEGGSPRYSSDNPDPETLKMQRQWPRLASKSTHGSEPANQSSEDHSSMHKKHAEEALGADFDPVPVPSLARRPAGSDNPYLSHLHSPTETASSSWVPRTPESP
ncbi:hypothetical protein [Sporisorium scitamineum]|uniref:Uncharacterized protein n=1 Tax=Sporisorium scitamineum TaxID=49012 RepID=A0A0F7S610_9BASI|nr:hypothetical protein [Sporisorium scitamineum]